MEFFKNFFDDDSTIVGLSRFRESKNKTKYFDKSTVYFTPSTCKPIFTTNFIENTLLV